MDAEPGRILVRPERATTASGSPTAPRHQRRHRPRGRRPDRHPARRPLVRRRPTDPRLHRLTGRTEHQLHPAREERTREPMTVTRRIRRLPCPVLPIVRVAVLAERRIVEMALPTRYRCARSCPRWCVWCACRRRRRRGGGRRTRRRGRQVRRSPRSAARPTVWTPAWTPSGWSTVTCPLTPTPTGPAAPGVVEDVADAAVIFSPPASRLGPGRHRQMAHTAVVITLLAATGLAVAHRLARRRAARPVRAGRSGRRRRRRRPVVARPRRRTVGGRAGSPSGRSSPRRAGILRCAGHARRHFAVTAWALLNIFLGTYARSVFTAVTAVGIAVCCGRRDRRALAGVAAGDTRRCADAGRVAADCRPGRAAVGAWAWLPLPVIPALATRCRRRRGRCAGRPAAPGPASPTPTRAVSWWPPSCCRCSVAGRRRRPGRRVSPVGLVPDRRHRRRIHAARPRLGLGELQARCWPSRCCWGLSLIVMFAVNGNFLRAPAWTLLGWPC